MQHLKISLAVALVATLTATSAHAGKDAKREMASEARALAYNAPQAKIPKAAEAAPVAQKIQMPPPEAMIIMIRSSLVALSQANVTNNYQVLNALGSQNFRNANPPARLAELFAPFRTNNIDLAPVVFVTPQLSQQPSIIEGKLRLIGYFPTQPMHVNYDLQFEPSNGVWKLSGLSVNLYPAQPTAQAQPQVLTAPNESGR